MPSSLNKEKIENLLMSLVLGRQGKGPSRPERAFRAILKLYYQMRGKGPRGAMLLQREWKYLLVLDACRYDFFEKQQVIRGKLYNVLSQGTSTPEWVQKNFNRECDQVVYISGNPYLSQLKLKEFFGKVPFHHLEPVWKYGWDTELGTVPPQEINKACLSLKDQFPNKRFILHYMQPHYPFIKEGKLRESGFGIDYVLGKARKAGRSVWDLLREGKVKRKEVLKAYMENLNFCLEYVKQLLGDLSGKIVITSDHGNLFGRYGLYQHPPYTYLSELREVPWMVINKDEREATVHD